MIPTNINCRKVQARFSEMLDGELVTQERRDIQAHIASCQACADVWETHVTIRDQLRQQGRVVPPAPAWATVQQRLPQPRRVATGQGKQWVSRPLWPVAAVVVLVLFAGSFYVTRGLLVARAPSLTARSDIVASPFGQVLGLYLRQDDVSNSAMYERLLTAYDAHAVSGEEMAGKVAFTPVVPEELPGGFHLENSYVLATRCCSGVHLRYMKGEQVIALFQQPPGHPVEYRGQGLQNVTIEGVACRQARVGGVELVQVDPDGRNFTLIARNNDQQLRDLVAFLARPKSM
ncbi:MAG: anti-sigma factor family protein [Acidobacteriota bacterium]